MGFAGCSGASPIVAGGPRAAWDQASADTVTREPSDTDPAGLTTRAGPPEQASLGDGSDEGGLFTKRPGKQELVRMADAFLL